MLEYIKKYIKNEIDYIKESMSNDKQNINSYKKDLDKLRSLKSNDIKEIQSAIFDDLDFEDYINEMIHEYLYDYIEEKEK